MLAVLNQASVSYADPKSGTATRQSNAVKTLLSETIGYYTNASYDVQARVSMSGQRLFVQASAPECNANPDAVDTIVISMTSALVHDTENYTATETAADSEIFRINYMVMATNAEIAAFTATNKTGTSDSTDAPRPATASANGTMLTADHDTLTATILGCGTGTVWASILIDPAGVVFDSKTGLALAGAHVSLVDVTGAGNGGIPGGPARVFNIDGVTPWPSTITTGTDGFYQFPLVAPSLYRLTAIAPATYTFPSKLAAAEIAGSRILHLNGSFGADFIVSAATGAVLLDLPVDPTPGVLYVEKSASRANAEVGEFVDYTVRVFNTAERELLGVVVEDKLPAGFSLAPGTVRLDGATTADPMGGRGPVLNFAIGAVPAAGNVVLRYRARARARARIGAGALQGDGINRARATSGAPLVFTSLTAAAKVKVTAGVFSEKGYIVGQVYADCDGDQLRGKHEPGVPGVRIYLEDGSFSVTDADGRYSFADVRPRTHIAKVDGSTLPQGAQLAVLNQRNGGDAGSRFVDLHDGELAKADFALQGCTPELTAALAARRNALKDIERRAAAVLAPAPVAKAVAASVHDALNTINTLNTLDTLDTLDNTLGFVDLVDGAVLPGATTKVRVKGGAGATFTLLVNGEPVSEKNIGQRATNAPRQLEVWEFVGVALHPGANALQVAQVDSFGNPRGTRTVKVIVPGKLAKIRLEHDKSTVPADGNSIATVHVHLEDENGVAVAERTALSLNASAGAWQQADLDPRAAGLQMFVEGGSAAVPLRAPMTPGEAQIKVASGILEAATGVEFVPDLRPLVAAGVIDGAISLKSIGGNTTAPNRGFDAFEDQLRHFSANAGKMQGELGGRAAMFAKGQVLDNTLLTMSYDSDKVSDQPLFRDLDPNAYYPTFGDGAQRGFDTQSTSRLYARANRDKSWLLYGDFTPPGVTPARNLGAYNRSLNGLRHHYEQGGLTVDSFASHDSTRQVVTEFAANGTSGPFLTVTGAMVVNSERIEIIVRSRNQPGVLLSSKQQVRWSDYDIEALTGRILFRAPIARLDADLNPVTIRVSYEIDQGSPQFWVAGTALQYRIIDAIEVGGSYVNDRNPLAISKLATLNATVRPDANTVLTVEAARMDKFDVAGRAARFDATRKDGKLESHVYAGRADIHFDNPSASLPKGRVDAGVTAVYRVDERISFGGEIIHSADLLTGASRDGGQLSAGYAFGNGLRVEAGVRRARENAAANTTMTQPDLTSVRAKVAAQVPDLPQAGVFVEDEQRAAVRPGDRAAAVYLRPDRHGVPLGGGAHQAQARPGHADSRHHLADRDCWRELSLGRHQPARHVRGSGARRGQPGRRRCAQQGSHGAGCAGHCRCLYRRHGRQRVLQPFAPAQRRHRPRFRQDRHAGAEQPECRHRSKKRRARSGAICQHLEFFRHLPANAHGLDQQHLHDQPGQQLGEQPECAHHAVARLARGSRAAGIESGGDGRADADPGTHPVRRCRPAAANAGHRPGPDGGDGKRHLPGLRRFYLDQGGRQGQRGARCRDHLHHHVPEQRHHDADQLESDRRHAGLHRVHRRRLRHARRGPDRVQRRCQTGGRGDRRAGVAFRRGAATRRQRHRHVQGAGAVAPAS